MDNESSKYGPVMILFSGIFIGAAGLTAIALIDEDTRQFAAKKAKQIAILFRGLSSQAIKEMVHNRQTISNVTLMSQHQKTDNTSVRKIEVTTPEETMRELSN